MKFILIVDPSGNDTLGIELSEFMCLQLTYEDSVKLVQAVSRVNVSAAELVLRRTFDAKKIGFGARHLISLVRNLRLSWMIFTGSKVDTSEIDFDILDFFMRLRARGLV